MHNRAKDIGHPNTTTELGEFQQPVLRRENRLSFDAQTKLSTRRRCRRSPGNAQTADLSSN
jgi:hypothetical protein